MGATEIALMVAFGALIVGIFSVVVSIVSLAAKK